jgi:hypothetical protein
LLPEARVNNKEKNKEEKENPDKRNSRVGVDDRLFPCWGVYTPHSIIKEKRK